MGSPAGQQTGRFHTSTEKGILAHAQFARAFSWYGKRTPAPRQGANVVLGLRVSLAPGRLTGTPQTSDIKESRPVRAIRGCFFHSFAEQLQLMKYGSYVRRRQRVARAFSFNSITGDRDHLAAT
ncbi:hypothetical protein MRX96_006183 [Rhipicephalus microplus]